MAVRKNSDLVVSYMTLRQMIGAIGLLMPIFVRLGGYLAEGIRTTGSISAYYYTGMHDVFVSTLVLVGILMACYRSPVRLDNILGTAAGIASIGIGLFPMDPEFARPILDRFPSLADNKCYIIHGIFGFHFEFVAAFFLLCFMMVTFRFPAFTPPDAGVEMRRRNLIYRICGVAMLLSFVAIGILALRNRGESIFWPETVAVIAFGAAWLVKGQTIFKDKPGSPDRMYAAAA